MRSAVFSPRLAGLFLALLLVLAALFLAAMALDPDSEPARAPWASPTAPDVAPAPLEAQ